MPKKTKDSYAAILKDTREVVKQIAKLQKNVKKILASMDEARDKAQVKRLRAKL